VEGRKPLGPFRRLFFPGSRDAMMESMEVESDERERWLEQVDLWYRRLAPRMPEIDPHDLRMILRSLLQPPSVKRRWLLRKTEDGRYVL
jgi:hypothetical protein